MNLTLKLCMLFSKTGDLNSFAQRVCRPIHLFCPRQTTFFLGPLIRLTLLKHHDIHDDVVDRNGRQRAVNVGAPHFLQQLAIWRFQIQSLDELHGVDCVGQRRSPPSLKGFELKHLKSKFHVRHQSRPKNFKNGTIKIDYWGDTWGNGDRVMTIQFFQFGLSSCHRVSCLFMSFHCHTFRLQFNAQAPHDASQAKTNKLRMQAKRHHV